MHLREFNGWLMEWIANRIGGASMFYLLVILTIGSLLFQRPHGVQSWILFWCTVFFQGVALSPIQYTGAKTSRQIDEMHTWMIERDQHHEKRHTELHDSVAELHKKVSR